MSPALAVLVFFLAVAGNFAGMLALTTVLGPKRRNPVKDEAFECGSLPVGPNQGRFHARFYMVAMLFLIFDIEVVFMYPWAMIYKTDLKTFGFFSMAVFLAVLVFGLIYEWRRGGMDWD
ncbi:MAG: NADH-quinone oxidoreductase subunit A [candidate division FCPU426 bacterium]